MTSTNFLKSLTITAAALGSKFGVPVYVGGKNACTDGQSIWLPDVEGIETIGRNEVLGYLVHECGHVRFTDMSVRPRNAIEMKYINALEDVRIEREMSNIYGGARVLLNEVHEPIIKELAEKVDKEPLPSCLGLYLCIAGAEIIGNYSVPDELAKFRNRLVNELGASLMDEIDNRLLAVPSASSTQDIQAIVEKILQLLREMAADNEEMSDDQNDSNDMDQNQPQTADSESQSGESSDGSKSDSSADQNQSSEDGESDGGQENGGSSDSSASGKDSSGNQNQSSDGGKPEEGQTNGKSSDSSGSGESGNSVSSESSDSSDSSASGSSGSDGASDSSGAPEGTDENGSGMAGGSSLKSSPAKTGKSSSQAGKKDKSEAAKQLLNASEKDMKALDKMDISNTIPKEINKEVCKHGTSNSCCPRAVQAYPLTKPTESSGNRVAYGRIEQAKADSTYARRALQGLVQARTRASTRIARSGMKLSTANMSRLATCDLRVFEKRSEKKAVNSAVHILLDMSGSMCRSEEVAIRASLALTSCLMTFPHVNPALSVFPGVSEPVECIVPHGQKLLRKSESAIASMYASGGTPLAQGLLSSAIALSQTREDRKVLIVVTDGMPDDYDVAYALIKKLKAGGVVMIGIGIGNGHRVQDFFDHYVSIDSVEDLQSKFFTVARELFV